MDIFYVYKIELLEGHRAGKYYIGQRKWRVPKIYQNQNVQLLLQKDPMLDSYAGSGTLIKNYFKTHGKIRNVTFIKTIIKFEPNAEQLNESERIIIGDRWQTDEQCLNLIPGGQNPPTNRGHKRSIEARELTSKIMKLYWAKPGNRERMSKKMMGEHNGSYGKTPWNKGLKGCQPAWNKGLKMNEEFCSKMKALHANCAWVYKDNRSKRIHVEELERYLSDGWMRGKANTKGHYLMVNGRLKYVLN